MYLGTVDIRVARSMKKDEHSKGKHSRALQGIASSEEMAAAVELFLLFLRSTAVQSVLRQTICATNMTAVLRGSSAVHHSVVATVVQPLVLLVTLLAINSPDLFHCPRYGMVT